MLQADNRRFKDEDVRTLAEVGLFSAGIIHEMKNALTVVLGFAALARTAAERAQSDPKVTRHLRELENETRRTVAQLQSFLSYSAGEKVPGAVPLLRISFTSALV